MIGLTLRQQVKYEARRRGNGWETVADELADNAVEICGSNWPCLTREEFDSVVLEVFRVDAA